MTSRPPLTYTVDPATGCWLTGRAKSRKGYIHIHSGGVTRYAHRIVYEQTFGPIPEGLYIDHLCRNRECINPAHMEPVTGRENVLRGVGPTAANAAKTHCLRGHEFTPENTYWRKGCYGRECKECQRMRMRVRRLRQRSAS